MPYPTPTFPLASSGLSVSATDHDETLGISWRRAALAALVTACLLFLADHDWSISKYEDFSSTSEAMEANAAGGNLIRGAAIFSLGAIGVVALFWRGGYALRVHNVLGLLMLASAAWCAASWFWSIEPSIALRRLIATGCLAVAALAAAKILKPRELAFATLVCTLLYLGIGILAELSQGTFQPWRADYRFAGTLHPNHQGLHSALLVMAAVYLAQSTPRYRKLFFSLAAVGLGALWMTKSRTPLAALVVAQLIAWFLMAPWKGKIIGVAAAVGLVCMAILVAGDAAIETLSKAALMGRADEDEAGTLSGRMPLWEELTESIAQKPLAGYGFNSFWIPRNIEDISDSQSWAISVGHSTYLDLTLGVGLIGAGLCISAVVWGLIQAVRLNAHYPAVGYAFPAVMLLFVLFHGLLESAFANPGFAPLVAFSCLAMLAFVDPHEYANEYQAVANGEASSTP